MINAEVQKSGGESTLSVIRKFSRRVQGTGLVKIVRGQRYFARATSRTVQKKHALKSLKRRADFNKLLKEGKVTEPVRRGSNRDTRDTRESAPRPAPVTGSGLGENTPIAR